MTTVNIIGEFNTSVGKRLVIKAPKEKIKVGDTVTDVHNNLYKIIGIEFNCNPNHSDIVSLVV